MPQSGRALKNTMKLKPVNHKTSHVVWLYLYEMFIIYIHKTESILAITKGWGIWMGWCMWSLSLSGMIKTIWNWFWWSLHNSDHMKYNWIVVGRLQVCAFNLNKVAFYKKKQYLKWKTMLT